MMVLQHRFIDRVSKLAVFITVIIFFVETATTPVESPDTGDKEQQQTQINDEHSSTNEQTSSNGPAADVTKTSEFYSSLQYRPAFNIPHQELNTSGDADVMTAVKDNFGNLGKAFKILGCHLLQGLQDIWSFLTSDPAYTGNYTTTLPKKPLESDPTSNPILQ